jgi:hypothetical protein
MGYEGSSTSAFSVRNVRRHKTKQVPPDPNRKVIVVSGFRSRDQGLFDPYIGPTMYGDYVSRGRIVRTILHD